MGSKKEGVFRGGPKGYSVSIPKTVKKQESKSSCCFRSLSESRSLDLCQGFKEKDIGFLSENLRLTNF